MTDPQQLERNKEVVAGLLNTLVNEGDPQRAADAYLGDVYIQHRHGIGDGKEAFLEHMREHRPPGQRLEIKRMLADGDLVAVHFHATTGSDDPGSASVDIFRVTDGRVTERWSVREPVPTEGDPVNANGIF